MAEAPRPERAARSERGDRDQNQQRDRDGGPDEGWNGPVPEFLHVAFTV